MNLNNILMEVCVQSETLNQSVSATSTTVCPTLNKPNSNN